jgi:xylulokinase
VGNLYLGFDAGTQSVKVSVYDESLNCLTSQSLPTILRYPNPGWVEMDLDEFLDITVECMARCVRDLKAQGRDPADVVCIMGDGIICGIAGVNEDGKAITPYINYLDSRTQDDVEAINAMDLDIWGRETGNPGAHVMFPAMFARWFLKNSSKFQHQGVKFMHNAPYILSNLAGLKGRDAFIDWGAMSGWGLGYKVMEKEWSDEQLEILGIDKRYMPRILKPWDIVGTLTKAMAERTGLKEGTKICAGAGDTMQSMIGSGNFEAGKGVDVAGTCAMFCVSTKGIIPELSKKGNNLIFNSGSLPDTYFYWGFIRTGGLALRWFKDSVCNKATDALYYQDLSCRAAKVKPGSNGVLFLPYLTGGQDESQKKSGCFVGLTLDDDQGVMWRSVLESIGYDYMEITDIYRSAGVNLDRITVTEGGSRDSLWNQIKSDMLSSEVVRYKNKGGAVVTNCLFAAYAAGDITEIRENLAKILVVDEEYKPDSKNTALYRTLSEFRRDLITKDMPHAFARLWEIKKQL